MADSAEEVKGKGLPANKAGGMRVPAPHEHPERAIQAVPKTATTEGLEPGGALVETHVTVEEKKLAQRELFKDQEKLHNPALRVPKNKEHKGPKAAKHTGEIRIVQPSKQN